MLRILQAMLLATYWAMPAVSLGAALYRVRSTRRSGPLFGFALVCALAMVVSCGVLWANSEILGARVGGVEFARCAYLTLAVFCVLRAVNWLLMRLTLVVARVKVDGRGAPVPNHRRRLLLATLAERFLLLALGIPYFITLLVIYRPQLAPAMNRRAQSRLVWAGASGARDETRRLVNVYEEVSLASTDGLRLAGWWVKAAPPGKLPDEEAPSEWGRNTVIVCPGFAASKENYASRFGPRGAMSELGIIDALASSGFNVLAIDPRGHGQSDGRVASFGALESRDVLAAAQWVRAAHGAESVQLFALGINTGAAAVLAAGAEPAGVSLDGFVLMEPYADLGALAQAVSRRSFAKPVYWLVSKLSLPIASAHAGVDLCGFASARLAPAIPPRPVLVVHGRAETFIPTSQEMDLYRSAMQPKEEYWPTDDYESRRARRSRAMWGELKGMFQEALGHTDSISADPGSQRRVIEFLRRARARNVL